MIKTTEVFSWNLKAYNEGKRFIVNQGGTSSSKTFSILQALFFIAKYGSGLTISVISESLPHLKKGAMKDFELILKQAGIYSERIHNKSEHSYKIGTSIIEFFSAEDSGKVTGPRRDVLFINECNNIDFSIYDQAEVRTKKTIFLDYNPTSLFWIHDRILNHYNSNELSFFESTYLNNSELSASIIRSIESRKEIDPDWFNVYGLGKLGTSEGNIFKTFSIIDQSDLPNENNGSIKIGFGMDFGFTNDPSTLMKIILSGENIYIHELMYQYGFTNPELSKYIKDECKLTRQNKIIADSSDPKSITELNRSGLNVHPAKKGKDSVKIGIDRLKRHKIFITKQSINTIKEFRNYKFKKDPVSTDKYLNEPVDLWNHCIDPVRYALDQMIDETSRNENPIRFHFG